jgi:hypothetical protein
MALYKDILALSQFCSMRKKTCWIILLLCFCAQANAQLKDSLALKLLEPGGMQEDIGYLKRLLVETHPGLYRYTPKVQMLAKFDSILSETQKPLPFYDFYKLVAGVIADVHCAHTYSLAVKDMGYFARNYKSIPLFLFPIQDKLYVLFNLTADRQVLPGFELVSVNGRPVDSICNVLRRYYWTDGHIEVSKQAVLQGQLFSIFYYSFIERPSIFNLRLRTLQGDTINFSVEAQSFSDCVKWLKKNPVNQQMDAWYNKKKEKFPWRLTFVNDLEATAMIRLDGFGGPGMDSEEKARQAMQKFMDESMGKIKKNGTKNLIIDVRANNGGWDNQGVELFTYLLPSDTAVKYYRRKHSVTDSSAFLQYSDLSPEDLKNVKAELEKENDGTFTLKEEKSPTLQLQKAKPNRFGGKVYILMDEKTFSTAAEFTAAARYYKVGIMVGQETPGAYDGGNGGSFIHLELPYSKIHVGTPLVSYQMENGESKHDGRGTIPDYTVSFTIDDVLQHRDAQLEFVKKLIREN